MEEGEGFEEVREEGVTEPEQGEEDRFKLRFTYGQIVFESLEEWEKGARELNGGKLPRYIVLLRLTEKLKTDPLCGFESAKELLEHTV